MTRKTVMAILVTLLVVGAAAAADDSRWINVHVTEPATNTNVEVHLPLNLVLTVMNGIRVDGFDAGKVELDIDDVDIDWPGVFAAIKDAPDGKFVTVKSDDADVNVSKQDGTMLIHVDQKEDEHAVVDVRVPMELVDALTIDDRNRIDVKAVLASLDRLPDGDLVRVTSDEANVRVWIE